MRFAKRAMALMVDQGIDGLRPLLRDGGTRFGEIMAHGLNPTVEPTWCANRAGKIWAELTDAERKALLEALRLTASDLGYPPEEVECQFLTELLPSARPGGLGAVLPEENDAGSPEKPFAIRPPEEDAAVLPGWFDHQFTSPWIVAIAFVMGLFLPLVLPVLAVVAAIGIWQCKTADGKRNAAFVLGACILTFVALVMYQLGRVP